MPIPKPKTPLYLRRHEHYLRLLRCLLTNENSNGRKSDHFKNSLNEGDTYLKDGELRDPAAGIFPLINRYRGSDHRDSAAAVEDVRVHRGQHHHSGSHVPGAVDVVRFPEHRAAPVQNLRLHSAARQ